MPSVLTFPTGPAEAFVEAIADELDLFQGQRFTRMAASAAVGATSITVETTIGWASAGKLFLNGQKHTYSGKTASSFTGLSPALVEAARINDTVVDWSGDYSALDQARASLFVSSAEGEFLDVIGRNNGFPRFEGISDATYRTAIRALMYGPKGTVFAIEDAMTALVGVGNFEVFEDLINNPCEVFIYLLSGALNISEIGKTFVRTLFNVTNNPDADKITMPAGNGVLSTPVDGDHNKILGVYLTPSNHAARFVVRPSSEPTTPWTYTGTTAEATAVTPGATGNGACTLTDASNVEIGAQYARALQSEPWSDITISFTMSKTSSSTEEALGLRVSDGTRAWGIAWDSTDVFLFDHAAVGAVGDSYPIDTAVHNYKIVKIGNRLAGQGKVQLWIDGVLKEEVEYSDFDVTTDREIGFGSFAVNGQSTSVWLDLNVSVSSYKLNHWNGYREAQASYNSANPTRITSGGVHFVSQFDERVIVTTRSAVAHGRNNGRWRIKTVDAGGTFVTVEGLTHNGIEFLDFNKIRIPERHFDAFTAEDAGIKATRTHGAAGAGAKFTAVYGGTDAHNITVALVNPAGNNKPLSISVTGSPLQVIAVQLATDGAGALISTAAEVVAAINAHAQAAALVTASTLDGVGAGVMAAAAAAALAGGEDGKSLTIANAGGNNGTHKIATLIDERTVLLGSHSAIPAFTVGVLGGAWKRVANFATEASVGDWEVISAGGFDPFPGVDIYLYSSSFFYDTGTDNEVHYLTNPGGSMPLDESFDKAGAQAPFYLFDQTDRIRVIIEALTVAGVRASVVERP